MTTASTKAKWSTPKSTAWASTTSRTATFTKDKCSRAECRAKASTRGPIRTFFRDFLCKIRWMGLGSWSLPTAIFMKDSSSITGPVVMVRWSHIQVMRTKGSSWTTWSRAKVSSTWKMVTYTRANSMMASGTDVARFSSQMRLSKKVSGLKTKNNDIIHASLLFKLNKPKY